MLNFKLDLVSPLFMDVQSYKQMRDDCLKGRIPPKQAFQMLRGSFPDMNDLQFFELDYEFSELRSIEKKIPRPSRIEYTGINSEFIRKLLNARNEPDFSVPDKFIQVMGRGTRSNVNPDQAMGRRRFNGNDYLPRN